MIDKSNDKLKKQIKIGGLTIHKIMWIQEKRSYRSKKKLSDGELTKFLNDNENFYEDAYFAQKYGSELFSNLIPKNIKNKKILEIGVVWVLTQKFLLKKGKTH